MLPEKFKDRMRSLLGAEYDSFIAALEDGEAVRGVRINSLKVDAADILKECKIPLSPLPYADDGFVLEGDMAVGASAEHHAGIFYMQDPGAMASVCAVDIPRGAYVLDMCAAPGGKSGQAAARIGDGGFLLSNEFVPKRAKITVGNFERLGITNAIVTSLDTSELPKLYANFFDFVIADVPCSGEGMFRKNSAAVDEWSEENVAACAKRQKEILENAAELVRPEGYIIYSTCTYSLEENEMTVFDFLSRHPDYSIVPVREQVRRVSADGISFDGERTDCMRHARRFYSHISRGEGQFVALLKREKSTKKPTILYKGKEKPLDKSEREAVEKFLRDTLAEPIAAKPYRVGENIVLISHGVPVPPNSVFSAGVLLGEIRKGILTPHHQFFSAYGALFKRRLELSGEAVLLEKYLRGEEIDALGCECGYCAVTYHGAAIGGGKCSGGRMKNHYPKGLRNK